MSDRELIEFNGNRVSINMVLDEDTVKMLRRDWGNVKGIQPPLTETYKNALVIIIPWMLKGATPDE